jgi:hypothetical protein
MTDIREVNRKLALASVLVMITVVTIIVDRLTGCSRAKDKVVVLEPPKAPPTDPPPPIKEPEPELLSLDEIEQAILEDVSRPELNQADRENYRYLVLSDIHNEGLSIAQPALAIHKTLNQLSSERFLKVAVPVDKSQSIYRVDLRDYFRSKGRAVWQRIERDLPVRVVSQTIRGQTLQFLTQAVQPWIHGRLFVETALTNETYYDIVGIPVKLGDFYKAFVGVVPQTEFDQRDPGLTLVGFQESVIAPDNRLAWRLEGINGAAYQTFDVDENNLGREQNLFQFPFVAEVNPLGRRVTLRVFRHAASEVITTLPNGMLAFGLYNAAGIRQNAAPQTVVSNIRAVQLGLTSEIRNARDCTGCHQAGYIAMRDELGPHIRGSGEFNAVEKQLGELFFKRQASVDAFLAQDNAVYKDALDRLQITPGPDPINEGLLDAVRTGLSAKEVASFLFLDEREFIEALRGSETVSGEVGALLRGGTISFQQFINAAPTIIQELNLFIDVE